ncbi:redoxin domain-containing protein [Rouxiella badensis]|uniref:Redoxin domain-containing protein n=1 Tax=Rahnella perminowiae TaxID=2816244 RepID=A0ABS6KV82_9GAMM|nr:MULTISPECIES: redoxin domain-containing protein [Yersiniaceae]MBU9810774.1 redoxin domain-containing protein [Rahnella perminowiae]MBU9833510.1 redoxin domain-containing protein [Rahnella perminowiae]MBU9849180.1 redoxin domain-containing protein [Rahnella aceris]MBU9860189.1 redoxin domain-containing protein [Rahnella aceris]MBU9865029.1 redoxin domain-containing protein [Rahnella aceris]
MDFDIALPKVIRTWLQNLGARGPAADQLRRSLLASDVVMTFAGECVNGVNAVLERVAKMPAHLLLDSVTWRLLPASSAREIKARAKFSTEPGGSLPSLIALDMNFELNEAGLISRLEPVPHHREPVGMRMALKTGDIAPQFTLTSVLGERVHFAANRDCPTLVVWTANGCPWALSWNARIKDIVRDYGSMIRTIHINSNDPSLSPADSLDKCRERSASGDIVGPYLMDHGQQVAKEWGARRTPDVFVVDKLGFIAYHGAPDADHRNPSLKANWIRNAIDHLLAGTSVQLSETKPEGCTIKWTF